MSPSRSARTWFARVAVVGLAVVGVQVVAETAASAHANAVSGVATCLADGSYTVNWTATNDWSTDDTVTVNSHGPSSSTLTPQSLPLTPAGTAGASGYLLQTNIPAGTATATIDIKGYWAADKTTIASTTARVDLTKVCQNTPPARHTATAPTFANGSCVLGVITKPSITIPADRGVTYTLDSKQVSPGTYAVTPGKHTVTASSATLTLTGATSWTLRPTEAPGSCTKGVTPVTPKVSQASCTGGTPTAPSLQLVKTPGITYSTSTSAPYKPGQSVVVTATLLGGHSWAKALANGWTKVSNTVARTTVTFAKVSCTEGANAVAPSFTSAACTGGTTPVAGSYTVPATKGVTYQVNGKTTAAGSYTAPWGATLTVMAVAKPGYALHGRTVWRISYPTAQHCAELAGQRANRTPDSGANTVTTSPTLASTGAPSASLIVGGIAAIVLGTMLTMLGSRRRRA